MMDDTTVLILLVCNLLLIGGFVAFLGIKHYELSVIIVVMSPVVSAIALINQPIDAVAHGPTFGSYIRVALLLLAGFAGLIKYLITDKSFREGSAIHFFLFCAFIVYALMSASYSIDQKTTLIESVSLIAFFCFLLGMSTWLNQSGRINPMINLLFYTYLFMLLLNFVAIVLFPGKIWWGYTLDRFKGFWTQPNELGLFCMTAYPIFLWKYFRSTFKPKIFIIGIILITVAFHLLSGSRTTLLASLIGICTYLIFQKENLKLTIMMGCLISAIVVLGIIKPSNLMREGYSATSMTGRTDIWKAALILASEKPIIGYGHAVSGKIFQDPRFYEKELGLWSGSSKVSLHNGYLDIFIGLGGIGFLLYYFAFLLPYGRNLRNIPFELRAMAFSILITALVTNLSETYATRPSQIGTAAVWICWVFCGQSTMITDNNKKKEIPAEGV